MTSTYDLKPAFQRLLRPIVGGLATIGVTPNQITILALLLSIVIGGVIAIRPDQHTLLLLLPLALLLRMALNAIDGMLAREHDMITPLGTILNELGDVGSDAALYLPLAIIPGIAPLPVIMLVVMASLTEITGISAIQIGATRRYDGPFGKSDRALLIGALGFALGLGIPAGTWVAWILWLATFLGLITIVKRIVSALSETTDRDGA